MAVLSSKNKPVPRPYEHQAYPSVRYRLAADGTIEHRLVTSADEDALLTPDWVDSPTKCKKASPAPPAKPAAPTKPTAAPQKPIGGDAPPKPPASPAETGKTDPA